MGTMQMHTLHCTNKKKKLSWGQSGYLRSYLPAAPPQVFPISPMVINYILDISYKYRDISNLAMTLFLCHQKQLVASQSYIEQISHFFDGTEKLC